MSNSEEMIQFGAYIVANEDFYDATNQLICARGEIALIFSRHRSVATNKSVDLMFERGSSYNGIEQELIRKYFRHLYTDKDFIICGCSTNDGWNTARQFLQNSEKAFIGITKS